MVSAGSSAATTATGAALRLRNLSVTLDDGTEVVKDAEVVIAPGERVLVAGESGTGKSTLVRAIAGLWPWGEGEYPGRERRENVAAAAAGLCSGWHACGGPPPIPSRRTARSSDEVAKALKQVGLGHLVDRLDEEAPWDQTLSGGEKQRLAFARILLHRPDIIVLDEATSALDPESQDKLMELLTKELDATTIVSVGHRPELEAFHNRKITLERRRGGAKFVSDIRLVRKRRGRLIRKWIRRRRGA